MKNSYEVRAFNFIKEIAPYLENCIDKWDYVRAVEHYMEDHPRRKVMVYHGATRIAVITSDYVLKFNYGKRIRDFGGCGNELRLYKDAVKDGYEYMFAKITAKIYNHKTYYIMPKINGIGKYEWDDVWEYLNYDESDWLHDHGVFDLHSGNYGWKNGRPVIIDYAAQD